MKFSDIQPKTGAELETLLRDTRRTVADLRFQARQGQLKNIRSLRVAKKTVSRILTALSNIKKPI